MELAARRRLATAITDRTHVVPAAKARTINAGPIAMLMPNVIKTPKFQGRSAHSMCAALNLGQRLNAFFGRWRTLTRTVSAEWRTSSATKTQVASLVARAIVINRALAHLTETCKAVSSGITRLGLTTENARAWWVLTEILQWKAISNISKDFNSIPAGAFTHLYFSFGYISSGTFEVVPMNDFNEDLFTKFTNVKRRNSGLKTIVALGDWTFNDNGQWMKIKFYLERLLIAGYRNRDTTSL